MFDEAGIAALISPVYPMVGARYDDMDAHLADLSGFLGFTAPYNLAGVPSITMPCGIAGVGMPIGVQLIAAPWAEVALLRAAHARGDWTAASPSCAACRMWDRP